MQVNSAWGKSHHLLLKSLGNNDVSTPMRSPEQREQGKRDPQQGKSKGWGQSEQSNGFKGSRLWLASLQM